MSPLARTSVLVATALLLSCSTPLAEASPRIAGDLVLDQNFPDPDVLETENGLFGYATNTAGANVQVAEADSARGPWQVLPDALPRLPSWVGPAPSGSLNVWAPDVSQRADGSYLMYYTAHHAGLGRQCIGAAVAEQPTGPFAPAGDEPLICHGGAADIIDPASFVEADGRRFLLYKDGRGFRARSGPSSIWIREMAQDGLGSIGPDVPILKADRPEEAGVVEAPTLVHRPEGYTLLFSANTFDSDRYFVNFATADAITGPYAKAPGALLTTEILDGAVHDPGGQDATSDALLFHGDLGAPGGDRGLFQVGLGWQGTVPVLG